MSAVQCPCGSFCKELRRFHRMIVDVDHDNIGEFTGAADGPGAYTISFPPPPKQEAN